MYMEGAGQVCGLSLGREGGVIFLSRVPYGDGDLIRCEVTPVPRSTSSLPAPGSARTLRLIVTLLAGLLASPMSAGGTDPATVCGPMRDLAPSTPALIGSDVAELQERLNELGYGLLAVDGVYGPKTIAAVQSFQRARGLVPDGVVGQATWEALGPEALPAAQGPTQKPEGELMIVVDTNTLKLTLYADGVPYKTYPVAVGRPKESTLSPVGEWRIVQKSRDWGGGFGTRWMGLNVPWGIYGIHGTNKPWSIGTRASAGCIRMFNRDVEELYSWVPLGTPVKIVGVEPDVSFHRTLRPGTTGPDVVFVQFALQERGFDAKGADGRFGPNTAAAVTELQRLYGLPATGEVYDDVYYVLDLK